MKEKPKFKYLIDCDQAFEEFEKIFNEFTTKHINEFAQKWDNSFENLTRDILGLIMISIITHTHSRTKCYDSLKKNIIMCLYNLERGTGPWGLPRNETK